MGKNVRHPLDFTNFTSLVYPFFNEKNLMMNVLPAFLLLGSPGIELVIAIVAIPVLLFIVNLIVALIHFNKKGTASTGLRVADGIFAGLSLVSAILFFMNSYGDSFLLLMGGLAVAPGGIEFSGIHP